MAIGNKIIENQMKRMDDNQVNSSMVAPAEPYSINQQITTDQDGVNNTGSRTITALRNIGAWITGDLDRNFNAEQARLNRNFQTNSQRIEMEYNAEEAEKNRQFQEMQRQTAYQTAVKDLKEAGLNPVLALNGGGATATSGAVGSTSAMSGSSASANSSGNAGAIISGISSILSSAMKIAKYS